VNVPIDCFKTITCTFIWISDHIGFRRCDLFIE